MKNCENSILNLWKLNWKEARTLSAEERASKYFLLKAFAVGFGFLLLEIILIQWIDKPLAEYTYGLNKDHPALVEFFRSITDIGKAKWYLPPCGIILVFCAFFSRGKDVKQAYRHLCAYIGIRAYFIFGTIAFSGIVANVLKLAVGRARPLLWLRYHIYGFDPLTTGGYLFHSMPSGHTTTVFALAFSLVSVYPRLRGLWYLFALVLAASRIITNFHYLSDVIAGIAVAWLSVRFFLRYGMFLASKVIFPIDSSSPKA